MVDKVHLTQGVVLASSVDSASPGTGLPMFLAQGGVAVAIIIALSYLIQVLVRLIEVSKADD